MEDAIYDFFKKLDRSVFLDEDYKEYANYDSPLPIGFEQTISQPTLVYGMTSMLELAKGQKVLEIGTGSGYQTAFLAEFAGEVYTVERIKELSVKAQKRLGKMGYTNIKFRIGDGSEGWSDFSPYDRIMVTAAAGGIPGPLVEQLATGGRMLIPVGERGMQDLMLVQKDEKGDIDVQTVDKVIFVELKGKYGWSKRFKTDN